MHIILCGSRFWKNYDAIERELRKLPKDTIVIHGAQKGADLIGAGMANVLGMKTVAFPADWTKYDMAAGPIRNKQMLDYLLSVEDEKKAVLAFHHDPLLGKGTKGMVKMAREANIEVFIFHQ